MERQKVYGLMTTPLKLSADEARAKILQLLEDGTLDRSIHCRERMRQRNITDLDLVHALKNGCSDHDPAWDDERNNWKYRIVGEDIEGCELIAITIIIEEEMTLFVVTVF